VAVHGNFAFGKIQNARHTAQCGCFACAVVADKAHDLARVYRQRKIVYSFFAARVCFGKMIDLQHFVCPLLCGPLGTERRRSFGFLAASFCAVVFDKTEPLCRSYTFQQGESQAF
jgi:hypothetical protein